MWSCCYFRNRVSCTIRFLNGPLPFCSRIHFMHPGTERENLKLGFCKWWIVLSTTTGTLQGCEEWLPACLWEHKRDGHLSLEEQAEWTQSPKGLLHSMKQKYKMPYNPKRRAGFYSADKHPEIQLNLTSSETAQEDGQLSVQTSEGPNGSETWHMGLPSPWHPDLQWVSRTVCRNWSPYSFHDLINQLFSMEIRIFYFTWHKHQWQPGC